MNRLTVKQVLRQQAPGKYSDGQGLYLEVKNANSKSWILRYKRLGVTRYMGLGSSALVTLEQARERARQAKLLARDGKDPLTEHRAAVAKEKLAVTKTFQECAEAYLTAQGQST